MRSKYGSYPEYHTSLDNFKLVTLKGLSGGYRVAKKSIINLQKIFFQDRRKEFVALKIKSLNPKSNYICEPNMGKRNLYPKISKKDANYSSTRDLMNFIQYSDGQNSLSQISKFLKISKQKNIKIFKFLKRKKLISI